MVRRHSSVVWDLLSWILENNLCCAPNGRSSWHPMWMKGECVPDNCASTGTLPTRRIGDPSMSLTSRSRCTSFKRLCMASCRQFRQCYLPGSMTRRPASRLSMELQPTRQVAVVSSVPASTHPLLGGLSARLNLTLPAKPRPYNLK